MNIDFKTIVTSEWFNRGLLLSKRTAVFNPDFFTPDYPEFIPDETIYNDYIEGSRITQKYVDETTGLTTYQGMFGGSGCDMFSGADGSIGGPGRGAANDVGEVVNSYIDSSLQKYIVDTPPEALKAIDMLKEHCRRNYVKSNYSTMYDIVSPYNIGNILINTGEIAAEGSPIYYSDTNMPISSLGYKEGAVIRRSDSIFRELVISSKSGMLRNTGIKKFRLSKGTEITIIPNDYISTPAYQCLINNGIDVAKPNFDYCSIGTPITLKITDDMLDKPYYVEDNGQTFLKFPYYTIQKEHCNNIGKRLLNYYSYNRGIVDVTFTDVINPGLEQYIPDAYPSNMGDYYSMWVKNLTYTYPNLPSEPLTSNDLYNWNVLKSSGNIRNDALGIYKIKEENAYITKPRFSALSVNYVEDNSLYCEKWIYTGINEDTMNSYMNNYLYNTLNLDDLKDAARILTSYDTELMNYLKDIPHEKQSFSKIDLTRYKTYQDDNMYVMVTGAYRYYDTIVDATFLKIEEGFSFLERMYGDYEYDYGDGTYLVAVGDKKSNIDIYEKLYLAVPSSGGSFYLEKFTANTGQKVEAEYPLDTEIKIEDGKTVIITPPIDIAGGVKPDQNEPGYVPPKLPNNPTIDDIKEFDKNTSSGGKGVESEVDVGFVLPGDSTIVLPIDPDTGEEYIEGEVTVIITDSTGKTHKVTKKVYYTNPRGKANSQKAKFKLSDLLDGLNVAIIDIKVTVEFDDPELANALKGITITNKLTDTINPGEQAESHENPPLVKDSMTDSLVISDSYYVQRLKSGTLRVSVTDNFEMTSESNTIKTLSSMDTSTQSNSAVLSDFVSITKTN